MAKKKKQRHLIGKKEFIFNFVSLVSLICIGVYFGGRSLYYYSLQNVSKRETENTLNSSILTNNMIVKDGEGLHQDTDGYYFKGNNVNNYVKYSNRLFRIIRINNDDTIRLVSENLTSSFVWGEEKYYHKSNLKMWLTYDESLDEGKRKYSGVYYNTLSNPENYIVKTVYTEDKLEEDKVVSGDVKFEDYVTTLGIDDYITAGGKNSYLNINKLFYIVGYDSLENNLYVEEDGSLLESDGLVGYGVRAVITFKKNLSITSGNGSLDDPYVISQGDDNNFIDSYVRLGNDVWKVYDNINGVLRLHLNGYIKDSSTNSDVMLKYSDYNSYFDLSDKNNIAFYLNNNYISTLTYSNYLLDGSYFVGEFSADSGYHYYDIYSSMIMCKVGLLNIFDYVSDYELDDYYRVNTTSNVGAIQYSTHSNGLLEESDILEEKHIVPVITIDSNILKSGVGTLDNPYVVE